MLIRNPLFSPDPFSPEALASSEASLPPTSNVFRFRVEGEAVPKLAGQVILVGPAGRKHGAIKAHPKTRRYEDIVRQRATVAWGGRPLITAQAIELSIEFYREPPKSFSKKDRAAALAGELRPITKPDCTNYAKAFEDGLKGVVMVDDALVTDLHVTKRYADTPRVEVTLKW